MERRSLRVSPLPEFVEEIGRYLWCLEDVRRTQRVFLFPLEIMD